MCQILPMGAEVFENLRKRDFYYIDKTGFIRELLVGRGMINLFARPRRFGKTLNMTMLKAFFEIDKDHRDIFGGLEIMREQALCERYMNRYPVIFLTLKNVEGHTFQEALERVASQVAQECMRLSFLLKNPRTEQDDQHVFAALRAQKATPPQLADSLRILSGMLEAHYKQKVILLVDEYDAPLVKACRDGYSDAMIAFMRVFLGEAFRTNDALELAVVTGTVCMSRESIFAGLNTIKIDTILSDRYDEYFGFTDENVRKILTDYNFPEAYEQLRSWYNGYHFGQKDICCPWDVVNHVDHLRHNPDAYPKAYWNNTSSNDLVKRFIDKADAATRQEIEGLIAGEYVEKQVRENLSCAEIDDDIDNLWNMLLLTGYLTRKPHLPGPEEDPLELVIPNRQVRTIFVEKVQKWFAEKVKSKKLRAEWDDLTRAFFKVDCGAIEEILRNQLRTTISYYYTEGYYHGFLAGLLKGCSDWSVEMQLSKAELRRVSGDGRSGLLIMTEDVSTGMIIEVKKARRLEELSAQCEAALRQTEEKNYQEIFRERGVTEARVYGIAFWKKVCRVMGKAVEISYSAGR